MPDRVLHLRRCTKAERGRRRRSQVNSWPELEAAPRPGDQGNEASAVLEPTATDVASNVHTATVKVVRVTCRSPNGPDRIIGKGRDEGGDRSCLLALGHR